MAEQSITKTSLTFLRLNHVVPLLVADAKNLKLIMHKSLHNGLSFDNKLNGWFTNSGLCIKLLLSVSYSIVCFEIQLQNTFVCVNLCC